MWDKKYQEINTYVGGKKSTETWKFVKKSEIRGKQEHKYTVNTNRAMGQLLRATSNGE